MSSKPALLEDMTILIVEDVISNQIIYQTVLEGSGARIIFNKTGSNILQQLHRLDAVDLILLDLMLPNDVNGLDVFQMIRSENTFSSLPVIAVTARQPDDIIPVLRSAGFAGLISKPLNFSAFHQQIQRVLSSTEFIYVRGYT